MLHVTFSFSKVRRENIFLTLTSRRGLNCQNILKTFLSLNLLFAKWWKYIGLYIYFVLVLALLAVFVCCVTGHIKALWGQNFFPRFHLKFLWGSICGRWAKNAKKKSLGFGLTPWKYSERSVGNSAWIDLARERFHCERIELQSEWDIVSSARSFTKAPVEWS